MMRNIDFLILQVFCADLCFLLLHLTEIILAQYRDEINFHCVKYTRFDQNCYCSLAIFREVFFVTKDHRKPENCSAKRVAGHGVNSNSKLQHLSGIRSTLLEI